MQEERRTDDFRFRFSRLGLAKTVLVALFFEQMENTEYVVNLFRENSGA